MLYSPEYLQKSQGLSNYPSIFTYSDQSFDSKFFFKSDHICHKSVELQRILKHFFGIFADHNNTVTLNFL